jgi:isopenicillin-N N-acyltransferase-like protein
MDIIMNSKGTISMNVMIAHRDGEAIDAECTPNDAFFIHPSDGVLTHSNHFLSSRLRGKDVGKALLPDTVIRSERAAKIFRNKKGALNFNATIDVLRDHFSYPNSICRHRDDRLSRFEQWETLSSLVINLSDAEMLFTVGPPCLTEYQRLILNRENRNPNLL